MICRLTVFFAVATIAQFPALVLAGGSSWLKGLSFVCVVVNCFAAGVLIGRRLEGHRK